MRASDRRKSWPHNNCGLTSGRSSVPQYAGARPTHQTLGSSTIVAARRALAHLYEGAKGRQRRLSRIRKSDLPGFAKKLCEAKDSEPTFRLAGEGLQRYDESLHGVVARWFM
jgi:hypothetical protein